MQLLELSLTVLATALPAILATVIVIELLGISRITKRMKNDIDQAESPELFESLINSILATKVIPEAVVKMESSHVIIPSDDPENDLIDEDDIEPVVVTSFDFIDETSSISSSDESTVKDEEDGIPFGDIAFQDATFSDFELIVSEDGSFELNESDSEEDEE